MPPTDREFGSLIARLEDEAAKRPLWYKTRVFLLALLGYAYVFGIHLVLLAIIGMVIFIAPAGGGPWFLFALAVPLAVLAWFVSTFLRVKLHPLEGRQLRRDEAPNLWAAIEDICRTLRARGVEVVLLTDIYHVAVYHIPRLGVFGWPRRYLLAGLPHMQSMPPDEYRGVLTHELAHVSRSDARFGNWIYRLRETWYRLMEALESEPKRRGAWMLRPFVHWYAPYFSAYSFALARRAELEADKLAAAVAGARAAARGLITSHVRSRLLSEQFWPTVEQQLMTQATPPADFHSRMASMLRSRLDPALVNRWVSEALAMETGHTDTHPAPRDRIAALGLDIRDVIGDGTSPAAALQETAAEHFLGDLAGQVTAERDAAWHERASSWWPQRHEHERAQEAALADLEQRHATLTDEELWALAHLTGWRRTSEAAEPYLRELLARTPRHARASFTLGFDLLMRDDEEGVRHMETVIDVNPRNAADAARSIARWLRRRGRAEEAERYDAKASQAALLRAAASKERNDI
jgi:Zn-dependent protease with chaperone function